MNVFIVIIEALFALIVFVGILLTSLTVVVHFEERKYSLGIISFLIGLGIITLLIYLVEILGLD